MVRAVAGVGCVALALVLGASASASTQRDALIRPGVGIGKVRLGMTLAQVRAAWGRPFAVTIAPLPRRGRTIELQYDSAAYVVVLVGLPGHESVVTVSTTLAKERLRQGVGVGSLERRLQRVFAGELHCERIPGIQVVGDDPRRCRLGDRDRPHTIFTSRIPQRYPWDYRPVGEWSRFARVSEVLVRAPGGG